MNDKLEQIKSDILSALSHVEAEDGLYLENLEVVHEAEERLPVRGSQQEILEALHALIQEGLVRTNEESGRVIFFLVSQ
jgi:hypothetical protein